MSFTAWRDPTPPIVYQPEAGDGPDFNWYYNESAGGHVLVFPKHEGQTICATSISYLYFLRRRFEKMPKKSRRHVLFLAAFEEFHTGLRAYAASNPSELRVPFGRKHQGERISDVNNPGWMLWTQKQAVLTDKYPVFFEAVKLFVDNTCDQRLHQAVGQPLIELEESPLESGPVNFDPSSEQNVHAGNVADNSAADKVPVLITTPRTPKRQHSSILEDDELPGISSPEPSTSFMPETPVKQKRDLSSLDMLPPANRS